MQRKNDDTDPFVQALLKAPQDGLVRILRALLSDMRASLARCRERSVLIHDYASDAVRPRQPES